MQQPQKKLNQRASHFILGNANQPGGSIYAQDYTKKNGDQDTNFKIIDPFKGSAINPPNKPTFGTTNNAIYKNWGNVQKAGLNKQKLQDLKSHHFHMGSYNPNQANTTNQYYYDQKQITTDATKNRQQAKNRMRSHYHDFKEQPYTNFKSTYNKQFTGKQGDTTRQSKPETGNTIVFGNHQLPMVTTSNADYTKKQAPQLYIKNPLQQSSSLVLGDKSQSMETMNQIYYGEKPITRNQLPQATMKQLRNTHFNLGGMSHNYQTEMTSKYIQQNQELSKPQNIPIYESGTWVGKDAKFDGRTTNSRDLPPRVVEPFSRAQPKHRGEFNFGNQGNNYTTQFSQNFNPKQGNYNGKVQKPKDNVVTGLDKGMYTTEHRANFKDRNLNDARCKVDIASLNKADHFQIGGTSVQRNITVYMDQYRKDQDNKSKLFHKDNL